MNEFQERQWIEAARRGDQDAFASLVHLYEKRVMALALRICRSPEDAAEAAQEAFLAAWQGLPNFRGEASFSTWLYRLTTNLCIDWLRRQKRRQETAPAVSLDDEEAGWAEPADWEQDPHRRLEASERGRALARGLERLPEYQRRPLVLRELSGLSYQEIAQALDLDLGTVKSRIARARLSLRKILLSDGNFFGAPPSNTAEKQRR